MRDSHKIIGFFSVLFSFTLIFLFQSFALAEDYASPSFIIRAPVVGAGGSNSTPTSTSFQANNSLGEIAAGISSGLNFMQAAGFSYFSITSTPATPPPSSPNAPLLSGGGGMPTVITGVNFSGRAYPLSRVIILKDGQVAATTISGPDAKFYVSLTGLSAGDYTFSVYGEDAGQRRSTLFTFPVLVTQGVAADIGGIFITPTIAVNKSEVKRGENVAIFGQSAPQSQITIGVSSDKENFVNTKSDKDGAYLYNFDTAPLEMGNHVARSKSALDGQISPFGKTVGFKVGTKTTLTEETAKTPAKGNLSGDNRVNLIDFSVAAYWYKRPLSEEFKKMEKEMLNGDGKIDLTDFSIMAYYWTG